MNRVSVSVRRLGWVLSASVALVVVVSSAWSVRAQAPVATPVPPLNPAAEQKEKDKAVDKEHMMTIWKALMAFQKARGRLPDYLSELVPEFLPDQAVLLSPARDFRKGKTDPKLNTAYIYEFRADPIVTGGPTYHDAKPEQMKEFGPGVLPILRCFAHGDAMNVTVSGTYFESPKVWETSVAARALLKEQGLGPGLDSGDFTELQLVDDATGKPVAGAQVELTDRIFWYLGLPDRTLQTDAAGKVRVPLGPPSERALRALTVSIRKPGLYGPREYWRDGMIQEGRRETGTPKEVTWRMKPAVTVGGVVRKSDGSPLEGATVSVFALPHFRDESLPGEPADAMNLHLVRDLAGACRTDAQGRWQCEIVPANFTELTVRVWHSDIWGRDYRTAPPGQAPRRGERDSAVDATSGVSREELLAQKAEFRVDPRVTMTVAVQQADGSPAPYQEVTMTARSVPAEDPAKNHGMIIERGGDARRQVRSGATGHVYFYWMEPMEVTVSAYPTKDSALVIRKVTVTHDMPPVELRAMPRRRVAGKVVDADGKPMEGVRVIYVGAPGAKVEKDITRTNKNGDFAWDAAPTTEVGLIFDHPGFVQSMEWVPVEKKEPLKVEMRAKEM